MLCHQNSKMNLTEVTLSSIALKYTIKIWQNITLIYLRIKDKE